MRRRPLKIGSFRRWLENRRSNMVLYPRNCKQCPIARYLGNSTRSVDVSVTPLAIRTRTRTITPPAWAAKFIRAFDRECLSAASPAKALEILLRSGYRKA